MTEMPIGSDTQDAPSSRAEATTDEDELKAKPRPKLDVFKPGNAVSLQFLSRVRPLTRARSDFYSIFSATTNDDTNENQAEVEPRKPCNWNMYVTEEEREMAARLKEVMDEIVDGEEEQAVATMLLGGE
ncbi:hypothetical protein PM082_000509 [Marasmius tenuissimus]|nr:hypothetical protein PM082_000509 [Marasmius tenuissimus]